MRCAVIADIHANLDALLAVLADAGTVDELWCLGDLVGYGPEPNECVAIVRERATWCLAGNNDWQATGKLTLADTDPVLVAEVGRWTGKVLSSDHRDYLNALPEHLSVGPAGEFTLVHGSLNDAIGAVSRGSTRLTSPEVAQVNFGLLETPYCLVGHSHVPLVFCEVAESGEDPRTVNLDVLPGQPILLGQQRLIVNPGSVGQPRGGDPRASYLIYEWDERTQARTLEFRYVPYDVEAVYRKLRATTMPDALVHYLHLSLERAGNATLIARGDGHALGDALGSRTT